MINSIFEAIIQVCFKRKDNFVHQLLSVQLYARFYFTAVISVDLVSFLTRDGHRFELSLHIIIANMYTYSSYQVLYEIFAGCILIFVILKGVYINFHDFERP